MIYDVAIIGGGVVGGLIARELAKYRLNICILEKEDDVAMGATRANSAIVHGGFDPVPGTLKAKLNAEGVGMFRELCRELDVPYKNNGSLVLAFSEEEAPHVQELYERGIANGIEGLSVISGDEARKLEKNLSESVVCALHCTSSGIVCPYELTIAAIGNAMDNGATLRCDFPVTAIEKSGVGYRVSSGAEHIEARYIVNAAGLYSDAIAAMLGDKYTVVAKKGEYLLFDKTEGKTVSHTIFQVPTKLGKGILVTPTVDGNLMIGPTSEKTEKTDRATSAAGLAMVRNTACKSVPKLNFRKVITSFSGLRASCSESEDFIIEYSSSGNHAINTVGIESPGLTSAPAIALYVCDMLKNAGLAMEKRGDFRAERVSSRRFSHMSTEEKNEVIKHDPKFGHVVCFCEKITEGEVLDAIHKNPQARSVDAVKRRTRAGMGGCQGGFCAPVITEILARELGIPEEQVTKFGGKSYMLLGKAR